MKISLTVGDSQKGNIIEKSITGEWLVGDDEEGVRADDDSRTWDAGVEWSVAKSAKGNLVVYTTHCNDGFAPEMKVYDSFQALKAAAAEDGVPINVVAETTSALGEEFEIELDI